MYKRTQIRAILSLLLQGRSSREIALTLSVSKNTVISIERKLKLFSLDSGEILKLNDKQLYALFYPEKFKKTVRYGAENFDYVHKELKKVGVTLTLLWEEYCDRCKQENVKSCCYATYTRNYKKYVSSKEYTSHVEHKPGVTCEVDWSGPTMYFTDPDTKQKVTAYLFVGTFPYSQKTYVEATRHTDEANWLLCHVHMFEFFGGTPVKIVCDNLRTGIIEHPRQGEIILNESYLALGEYYSVAIIPTGVKKPKHKPSVEGSVGKIASAIIAKLRNEKFNSIEGLNQGIRRALGEFNSKKFQKRNGSRDSVFELEEKPYLKQLPLVPFEVCNWTYEHLVGKDSHVQFRNGRYSVPSRLIGQKVDIKSNTTTVSIFSNRELVATHQILPEEIKNGRRTDVTHLPYLPFEHETIESIKKKAASVGENTYLVAEHLIDTAKVQNQAISDIKAILDIARTNSTINLENACRKALAIYHAPKYSQIIEFINQPFVKPKKPETKQQGIVRGADYYKKEV